MRSTAPYKRHLGIPIVRNKTLFITAFLLLSGLSTPAIPSGMAEEVAQKSTPGEPTKEELWLEEEQKWWEEERQRLESAKKEKEALQKQSKAQQQKAEERRIEKLIELLEEGKELVKAKDFEGALWAYRQAAELEQEDPKIYSGIGFLHTKQGNFRNAAKAYQRAIALSPKTAAFHQALGFSLAQIGDYQGAATAYRQVRQLDPKNFDALLGLGAVLLKGGDLNAAAEIYREAIAFSPKNPTAHELLGTIYLQQERYADASDSLAKARQFALGRGSSTLLYNLGVAQINQGNTIEGLESLKQVAAREQNNATLQFQLGEIVENQGKLAEAIQFYDAALAIKPEFIAARIAKGELQLAQRQYAAAEKTYRILIEQFPKDPGGHYNLGIALQGQNNTPAAIAALETARKLYKKQKDQDSVARTDSIIEELQRLNQS